MRLLKQNTATNLMVFMSDVLDHATGKTGLTLSVTASKDGAAFGSIAPTVTERGSGWYNLALTAAMVDTLGDLALHVTASGADSSDILCRVVAGSIDADVSTRLASASYTAPDNANIYAIKAKTDNLPSDPASETTLTAISAQVDGLDSYDDTELKAMVSKIWKILGHKVITIGKIHIFYEADGITVWKRFDTSNKGRVEI